MSDSSERILSVKERLALLNSKANDSNNSVTPKKEESKSENKNTTVIGSSIKDRITALNSPASPASTSSTSSNSVTKSEITNRNSISEKIAQLQSSSSSSSSSSSTTTSSSISPLTGRLSLSSSEVTSRNSITEKKSQLQYPSSSSSNDDNATDNLVSSQTITTSSSTTTHDSNITIATTPYKDNTDIESNNSIKDRIKSLHSSSIATSSTTEDTNTGHIVPERRKSSKITELGANINISFLKGMPPPRTSILGSPLKTDTNDDTATITVDKSTASDSTGGIVHLNLTRATRSKKPSSNSKKFIVDYLVEGIKKI